MGICFSIEINVTMGVGGAAQAPGHSRRSGLMRLSSGGREELAEEAGSQEIQRQAPVMVAGDVSTTEPEP